MLKRLKGSLVYKLARLIYSCVASKLPSSYNAKTKIPKKLRAWCAKFLLDYRGKDVNIEKNVELRWGGIELGDRCRCGGYQGCAGVCDCGRRTCQSDSLPQSTENTSGGEP